MALLIAVVVNHYSKTVRAANETALRSELAALRNTINLFGATRGRCPESLGELLAGEYVLPFKAGPLAEFEEEAGGTIPAEEKTVFRPEYLKAYALDEEGNILDPFGLPYSYDRASCTVRSQKPGYEGI